METKGPDDTLRMRTRRILGYYTEWMDGKDPDDTLRDHSESAHFVHGPRYLFAGRGLNIIFIQWTLITTTAFAAKDVAIKNEFAVVQNT